MEVTVVIGALERDRIEDAIKLYSEKLVPAAHSEPGYLYSYLCINRETGEAMSLSGWAENCEPKFLQQALEELGGFLVGQPSQIKYDTVIEDRPSAA